MRQRLFQIMLCGILGAQVVGCASPLSGLRAAFRDFEQSHVFQPNPYPAGDWSPAAFEFEDVWFTAADGTRLNGWYYPHEKAVGIALFAHGNGGNLTHCAEILRSLHNRHRLSIMAFDYRGYGKSEGTPVEEGILQDAIAARQWLEQRERIAATDVILVGQSLGGGIMVDLAANDNARGLVLISTFTSLPDVAAHHYPLLPSRSLMHNRFDSIAKIGDFHGRLLQVHGDKDRTVPLEQAQRLFAAANEPKRFVANHGGDHNDRLSEEFHKAFEEFQASLPPVHRQPPPPRWRSTQVAE